MIDLFIEKDKKQKVKREIQSSSVDKLNRIVDLSVCFYTNKEWINCDWRLSKHPLLVSKMFETKKKTKKQNKTKHKKYLEHNLHRIPF